MRWWWITLGAAACVVPYYGDEVADPADPVDSEPAGAVDSEPPVDEAPPIDTSPLAEDDDEEPGAVSFADGAVPAATCEDAMVAAPVASGVFTGSLAGYGGTGRRASCINYGTNGPVAYHKVMVPPGQRIAVSFEALGLDSQVMLMRDCNDWSTCIVGADAMISGSAESISFTNSSAVAQTAYLVLGVFNNTSSGGDFDLIVEVQ